MRRKGCQASLSAACQQYNAWTNSSIPASYRSRCFFSPQSLYIHQAKYVFIPKCLQTGSVCLPQSLSVCVLCILFVDSAASPRPSCIRTSRAESFSPLGLLRDRFNCGGIFTKPSKQPHRNWQARQNCSHDTPRAHKHVAHKGSPRVWSREQTLLQTRCLNRHNPIHGNNRVCDRDSHPQWNAVALCARRRSPAFLRLHLCGPAHRD